MECLWYPQLCYESDVHSWTNVFQCIRMFMFIYLSVSPCESVSPSEAVLSLSTSMGTCTYVNISGVSFVNVYLSGSGSGINSSLSVSGSLLNSK